jgi:hypothetical protein
LSSRDNAIYDLLGNRPWVWGKLQGVMNEDFPADIKQFIADHIDSVAQLELLLLMRNESAKAWTAEEAGKALYSAQEVMGLLLADLQSKRLVAPGPFENSFVYRPEGASLADFVDRLAELYRDRRVAVITAIYTKPTEKIRSFADAFRLRKEK